jgi:tetratricopeptide (TPR) repeat protein
MRVRVICGCVIAMMWIGFMSYGLELEGRALKGEKLYLSGDYVGAVSAFKEALKENPDDVEALFLLALALYELGEDEEAKANLKLAHDKLSSDSAASPPETESPWRSLAGTPFRAETEPPRRTLSPSLNPALIKFPSDCKVSVFRDNLPVKPDPVYSTSRQPVYALQPGGVYRVKVEPGVSGSNRFIWIAVSAAIIGFLAMR